MRLDQIYKIVQPELNLVSNFIKQTLADSASKAAVPLIQHILKSSGKHVRPLLCILTYRLSKKTTESPDEKNNITRIASAIELIHIASLVHDDVIDNASTRRNHPTINAKWDNKTAVTIGIYLYSIAIQLISDSKNLDVLDSLSYTVNTMCDGELHQLAARNNVMLSESEYYKIIQSKTANLFQSACECGSFLSKATLEEHQAIQTFGQNLGLLFQLTDDYLDYFSDGSHLKKEVGQDFKAGQVTLPLIWLQEVTTKLSFQSFSFNELQTLLYDHQIPEKLVSKLTDTYNTTIKALEIFPSSPYRSTLIELAKFILKRAHIKAPAKPAYT